MKAVRKCCVCIGEGASYWIEEADENNLFHKTKLNTVVPEIDWNTSHYLCDSCLTDLNVAHRFKKLCLNSLQLLQHNSTEACYIEKRETYFSRCNDFDQSHSDLEDDSVTQESIADADREIGKVSVNVHKKENNFNSESSYHAQSSEEIIISSFHDKCIEAFQPTYYPVSFKKGFQKKLDPLDQAKSVKNDCNFCRRSYKRKFLLDQHVLTKHTEKTLWKHQCCYCDEVFPTNTHLISHSKKQHSVKETVVCFHCNRQFTDKNILLHHIIQIHQKVESAMNSDTVTDDDLTAKNDSKKVLCGFLEEDWKKRVLNEGPKQDCSTESSFATKSIKKRPCRTFSCETCPKVFSSSVKLIEHCVAEHQLDAKSVRPFSCDLCDKRFTTSATLTEHKRYHTRHRQNICSFCGKGFITKRDLNCHEFIHLNERSFKCEVCFKGFNTRKNLRTHRIVKHGDPMSWKHCCTICNKRFAILSNYKVHVRRHMGDKQFCCHLCDKKFVNKDELRQHTESHSNVRKFKCQYCEKEYKKKRVYEIHLTKNHGIGNAKIPKRERKHVCHLCPKSYFDKSKLNKHLMSHSGIKPFICGMCDKKFTDNHYLKQHIKNTHCDFAVTCDDVS